ncbi:MAG: hypothetical protein AMJ92_03405 [candidate division Zixibacteria bacterium SM23_81]|nr:MAG: hypothetical protein AMJ92_03405 [candidate division Zixibacteria bacterium SM23_81]
MNFGTAEAAASADIEVRRSLLLMKILPVYRANERDSRITIHGQRFPKKSLDMLFHFVLRC